MFKLQRCLEIVARFLYITLLLILHKDFIVIESEERVILQ